MITSPSVAAVNVSSVPGVLPPLKWWRKPHSWSSKKTADREEFSRDKMLRGLIRACEKRPVSVEQLDMIVSQVENAIRNTATTEVDSQQIGELVMEQLYPVDEVAYVRFASVYRQFKDINMFMKELKTLLSKDTASD